jgi:hypothetical protein
MTRFRHARFESRSALIDPSLTLSATGLPPRSCSSRAGRDNVWTGEPIQQPGWKCDLVGVALVSLVAANRCWTLPAGAPQAKMSAQEAR